MHADPVLIGENREFLAAIDSRFNISEEARIAIKPWSIHRVSEQATLTIPSLHAVPQHEAFAELGIDAVRDRKNSCPDQFAS